ncbi:MAG: AAA family ATPase [Oscillatoria sp. SIO1A7]|nr:AAA family ATPase [Oscillatoria sp. SIO1A7]
MPTDLNRLFRACDPAGTLRLDREEGKKYYIDFSSTRGGEAVKKLANRILRLHPEQTCQLFTGHIGCGKSTELLRLKKYLEQQDFLVVYFDSSDELNMKDVEVSDILLAIARQTILALEQASVPASSRYLSNLLKEAADFLQTPVTLGVEAELSAGFAKVTAKTKDNREARSRLRQYLEPRTDNLIQAINEDLLQPARKQLAAMGKKGLVAIVDSLEKLDNRRINNSDKTLPEYLFGTRGRELSRLDCHVIYTIPFVLMFSNAREALENDMAGGRRTEILPMVPVRFPDGSDCSEGLELLQQMVLARAFPDLSPQGRLGSLSEIFDRQETLIRSCKASGGHVRKLLSFLFSCLEEQEELPITRDTLEVVLRQERQRLARAIDSEEWQLLRKVRETKEVIAEKEYETLLRSLFVFGYNHRQDGEWFDVNPILLECKELS